MRQSSRRPLLSRRFIPQTRRKPDCGVSGLYLFDLNSRAAAGKTASGKDLQNAKPPTLSRGCAIRVCRVRETLR